MIWYHLNLNVSLYQFCSLTSFEQLQKIIEHFQIRLIIGDSLFLLKTIFIEKLLIIKMPGFSKQKTHCFAISHYLSNIFKWYRHPFTFGRTFSYIFHRAVTLNWHLEMLHHRGFERSDALSYRPMGAECWTIPWIPWGKRLALRLEARQNILASCWQASLGAPRRQRWLFERDRLKFDWSILRTGISQQTSSRSCQDCENLYGIITIGGNNLA